MIFNLCEGSLEALVSSDQEHIEVVYCGRAGMTGECYQHQAAVTGDW